MIIKATNKEKVFEEVKCTETFWHNGDLYMKVRHVVTTSGAGNAVNLILGTIEFLEDTAPVIIAPTYLVDAEQENWNE